MSSSPLDLLGRWRLSRTIEDHLTGETSTVDGTTTLSRDPDGRVRWTESGTWFRAGAELPISRTLFVEDRSDGWFVTFEDGRDFHPWTVGSDVVHPCNADTYAGRIDVKADEWTVVWHVAGPSKDYTMCSTLRRE